MELLISLIGGTIGSNAAAKILKHFDQEWMFNSIIGVFGGVIGGQILASVTTGSIDLNSSQGMNTLCLMLAGAAGGSILLPAIGLIKNVVIK